jgi:Tfp pilus assembly protein PilV
MELPKLSKKYYFNASSLLESVIAVSIIAVCLLVALKMYITILDSRPSVNNFKQKYKVEKLFADMKLNPQFESELYDFKTFKIRKIVSNDEHIEKLKKISYSIEQPIDTVIYTFYLLSNEE